ncbi:hypothetical protein CC2G_010886 [Coprinopsis cinerea AmutBmut pab1-1]|nr:hypothetical protein CC2G_010886 [Coprinopsis cinerea AmutBmut pab1-1]
MKHDYARARLSCRLNDRISMPLERRHAPSLSKVTNRVRSRRGPELGSVKLLRMVEDDRGPKKEGRVNWNVLGFYTARHSSNRVEHLLHAYIRSSPCS